MLFNSSEFILIFLPIVVACFFLLASWQRRAAALWLGLSSLFFYGWWNPKFVILLLASISFNYVMGIAIVRARDGAVSSGWSRRLMGLAIIADLLLLCYFKYTNFFIETVNKTIGTHLLFSDVVLPLGISFFTFTQIAFLVDAYRGLAREYNFIHYLLFVTYFPHLIAGPVLHHKQMMPQFDLSSTYRFNAANVTGGLTIFIIGLAKKVVLADSLAPYASSVFKAADLGTKLTLLEAWGGSLAYTFQLYFDFSGYSDMAIGLSLLFGIKLPINFNSPYRAKNIIEFWRRWHITLSQFLRDYLYIPLGGNRKGPWRRHLNLMITMLLGGLWHGANWTFVIWGGLHGIYLLINHLWISVKRIFGTYQRVPSRIGLVASQALTLLCVIIAWVFFRAESIDGALIVLSGMAGFEGVIVPQQIAALVPGLSTVVETTGNMPLLGGGTIMGVFEQGMLVILSAFIALFCPSTQSLTPRIRLYVVVLVFGLVIQGVFFGHTPSEFLYFQF